MKKLLAIVLAMVIAVSGSCIAFADDATTTATTVSAAEAAFDTVKNVIDTIISVVKSTLNAADNQVSIVENIEAIAVKILDLIENIGSTISKTDVAGAVADLESKIAELGLGSDTTLTGLLNKLKQKIKDFYAGERATVEEVTEAEAPAETGSSSIGICAFAAVSVACAAAFVCTKKKD